MLLKFFAKYINQNYSTAMNYAHIGRLYKLCIMHMNGVYYNIITLEVKINVLWLSQKDSAFILSSLA